MLSTPWNDRLGLLLESSGDGVFGIDRNGHYVFINRAGLRVGVARAFAIQPKRRLMDLQRQPDPNGDRVNIVMSGKFLPYKLY